MYARVKDAKTKRTIKKECAIVTDIEGGIVIEMWEGITIDELITQLPSLPNPERVKIVVIDMSLALLAAVKEVFPNAIIIIDLFHVQKKINEGFDNVRKRLRKGVRRVKGQQTMCRRELLRKRRSQLKPHELKELDKWFEFYPELRLAQQIVEACLEIWHSSSSRTARDRYLKWLRKFPAELRDDFRELLSAFHNWGNTSSIISITDLPMPSRSPAIGW